MRKFQRRKYLISLLLMALISCFFFTLSKDVYAIETSNFLLAFENESIGDKKGDGWQFAIYDGVESGVCVNPTKSNEQSLKISSNSGGNGGIDWLVNTEAFQGFNKEINIVSVDFYFPAEEYCDEKDCIYLQAINGSNRYQPFAVYADCIQAFSSAKNGTTYKTGIARNEWFTVSFVYYTKQFKYDVVYEKAGVSEVIASGIRVSNAWGGAGLTNLRVMSRFDVKDGVRYAYVDNVKAYAYNKAPILSNLEIKGLNNNAIGEILTAEYDYFSDLSNEKEQESFQWYRSDKVYGGVREKILGANSKTYTTTQADLNKYLSFEVQVTDDDGNESSLYQSRGYIVYDNKDILDFEDFSVGDDVSNNFSFDKTANVEVKVDSGDNGKYLSVKGLEGEQSAQISFESKYDYGIKNKASIFEFDVKLDGDLKNGDFIALFLVVNTSIGESTFRCAIIEGNTLYVGQGQRVAMPTNKWLSVRFILLDNCSYFAEVSSKEDGTFYNSQPVLIDSIGFKNNYDEVGLSKYRIYYEVQNSYLATAIAFDNFRTYATDGALSLKNYDFGQLTKGETIDLNIPYIEIGKVQNVIFQPTAGAVPTGLKIENGKIVGQVKKAGKFAFTITAFCENGSKSSAIISGEVLNSFTIQFNTNGGQTINSLTLREKSLLPENLAPAKEGYLFVGWYKDNAFNEEWDTYQEVVQSDIVLYAKWIEKEYAVYFYDAYGKIIKTEVNKYKQVVELPEVEQIEGYTFVGWFLDSEFTQQWNEGTTQPAKIVKLYGKWVKNEATTIEKGCSSNICSNFTIVFASAITAFVANLIRRRK